ncbi:MAG: zinc-binding alcohol dehydrogenase [Chloroflexota bacterium]
MKSLMLVAPYQLEWIEQQDRILNPNEVMVETIASAISIGSELPQYAGTARSGRAVQYPKMTGYENVGRVVEIGSHVENVRVGQRVVAFYGYRTKAIVDCQSVIPVDEDISDKVALLTILSCDVAKGIRKLKPYPEESVLVTGCGTIGLLACYVLSAYGLRNISAVDAVEARQDLALALGARVATSPTEVKNQDTLYDLGIECSSFQDAFALLQTKMKLNGKIAILSDGNREPLVLLPDFHAKELTLFGSSDGWNYAKHAEWFLIVSDLLANPLRKSLM